MGKLSRRWLTFINNLNQRLNGLGLLVHFLTVLIVMLTIFSIINAFVLSMTTVKGHSMEPILYAQDRLIIFKSEIKLKNLFGQYVPDRGDIIVFETNKLGSDQSQLLIKRVVGLPNERLIIEDQRITIYNEQHPAGFVPNIKLDDDLNNFNQTDFLDVKIGNNQIFVLGDNRNNSQDSRSIGNIPLDSIQGELIIRIWPFNNWQFF